MFCSLSYPACKAHEPYCHLRPVALYNIFFPTLSRKRHDLWGGGELMNTKWCVSIFSTTFVWNVSHSKKNSARYNTNVARSSCKIQAILVRFKRNLEFSLRIFEERPNIKFRENSFSGSRIVPRKHSRARARADEGRRQWRTGTTKLTVVLRSFANAHNTNAYSFTLRTSTYNHLKPSGYYMYHQV